MNGTQVREYLIQQTSALLLGPMLEDEVLASNPSDTYLSGILWPAGTPVEAADDDAGTPELDSREDDTTEAAVPGYRAVRPCSIGLTCSLDIGASIVIDLHGTARYVPVWPACTQEEPGVMAAVEPSVAVGGETATDRASECTSWKRQPLHYRLEIDHDETRQAWRERVFLLPDGGIVRDDHLALDIRRRPEGDRIVLTVTLINTAPELEPGCRQDELLLFQSCIRILSANPSGAGAIRPRGVRSLADDEDALTNLLLYRDVYEFAVGHGVSVEWAAPEGGRVSAAWASWLPRSVVAATSSEGHKSLQSLRSRTPNPFAAQWLAKQENQIAVCDALDAFCELYDGWIDDTLQLRLNSFDGDRYKSAVANLKRCGDTLARMRCGVSKLRQSHTAWEAFALANRAMDLQSRFDSKGDGARPLIWRPFQLAFFLLVLPSIADGADPARGTMDLLWFPTGGGKTEAYLGLTAFQIFLRRLEQPERRQDGGVDVLMRYTLRLLTVQQFQRAAALVCACEALRSGDAQRLGTAPISLGLYVGDKSTPNRLDAAKIRLEEEYRGERPTSTPRQLLKCPVCGGDLFASAYRMSVAEDRVEIRCPAPNCATAGQPLPVMTVDDELYKYPPSLLIGTVDKFAQLPRRTDIRALLGLDSNLRPGLIIQDELHLISGPLGSMAGLYEAAIDRICTVDGVRPKVVGSTATIGRARRQVLALFDRDVLQFPPPGFDASDSFFAVRDDVGPDRMYIGISTAGRSPKFALQAVMAALLQSADSLRQSHDVDDAGIDPYWTCVTYFNSLRELGGAHVLMQDDVPRQMRFLARRLGLQQPRVTGLPKELSSRVPSREIPEVLLRLEQTLVADDPFAAEPVDAVLASNMISVGVDISRLGLMVVNGQPKSTAEYIQATSRVGRRQPGLVLTLYNFGRPRDLSHFEHFAFYHGALYRAVEATSVTPWAPRARDKALHAVLIALVRHVVSALLGDEDAITFDGTQTALDGILRYLVERAKASSGGLEGEDTEVDLHDIVRTWVRRARESRAGGTRLRYWEKRAPFGKTAPHLMRASEELRGRDNPAWPTPNSMRDIEPSTAFVLKRFTRKRGGEHGTS